MKNEEISKFSITEKSFPNDLLSSLIKSIGNEISPICAILGGIAGQEIIKIICKNDEPFNNFFFYNAMEGTGTVQSYF